MPDPRRARSRAFAAALIVLPTAWLAYQAIGGVTARLGHPGAAIDDSYIHFQYARAIAEGHPFRFHAGEPFTMGATSLLWPALLAPFYAVGFKDEAILWPAWAMSFVSLGFLAHEAYLLARRLVGVACAAGAGAMVLSLSALTWFAASGMEVVPFAFCIARAARRSSEWAEETSSVEQGPPLELLALAWLAPLLRPEGAVAAAMIGVTLLRFRRSRGQIGVAVAALAAPLFPAALSLLLTGSAASNTAQVKLLIGNPYFVGPALTAEIGKNLRILFGTLLDGEIWSAEFLPKGSAPLALAGLLAIVVRGYQTRSYWRAACLVILALTLCAPCCYVTFLWNRLRYLWPFAPMWLIGIACLARIVGDALGRVRPRGRVAGPLLCGVASGMLFLHQSGSLQDVADSASGIERQQVALGRWAKANLPEGARIGVNDTGAIGYLSDRHTFDIVGLTTKDEGRYWVAGAASRFEHYERLHAQIVPALPTHYIVYPEWMACDAVLGPWLHEATVLDATILGGRTMRVYEADDSLLGTGELPWTPSLDVYDALDVADLESEAAHHYELLGARDGEEVIAVEPAPGDSDGKKVADGGRTNRAGERFSVDIPAATPSLGTVRLLSTGATRVQVLSDGANVAELQPEERTWGEYAFLLAKTGRQTIELRADGGTMTVFHYWFSRATAR
jgi:hypothetical protein